MTVHNKANTHKPQKTDAVLPNVTQVQKDDSNDEELIGARGGKEQDTLYREQSELLGEVKEKYREADLEAEKKVQEAIGSETQKKLENVIPPELVDHGVKHHEEYARDVLKHGGTLELPISEADMQGANQTKISGKSLLNKSIVGVSSLAALAIFVGRIVKVAHKHARRVIFRGQKSVEEEK